MAACHSRDISYKFCMKDSSLANGWILKALTHIKEPKNLRNNLKDRIMTDEEKREQMILNIAEEMRREPFRFEFVIKENPEGIKITYEVTEERMTEIVQEMILSMNSR